MAVSIELLASPIGENLGTPYGNFRQRASAVADDLTMCLTHIGNDGVERAAGLNTNSTFSFIDRLLVVCIIGKYFLEVYQDNKGENEQG